MLDTFRPIVAVAEAHAAALFPRVSGFGHTWRVLRCPIDAVLVARVTAPAIVNDDLIFYRRLVVKPSQQFGAAPLIRGHLPLAIAEDEGRLVAGHHILVRGAHVPAR